jgi:hypothetical protein
MRSHAVQRVLDPAAMVTGSPVPNPRSTSEGAWMPASLSFLPFFFLPHPTRPPPLTRLAPAPTGHLHLGHVASAVWSGRLPWGGTSSPCRGPRPRRSRPRTRRPCSMTRVAGYARPWPPCGVSGRPLGYARVIAGRCTSASWRGSWRRLVYARLLTPPVAGIGGRPSEPRDALRRTCRMRAGARTGAGRIEPLERRDLRLGDQADPR